ncbi:MAG: His/Gly/Thr/Pro-type tRNA ligase C-terminal domain-containing protein [Candidatus Magasanikbacteria bacterium]|nr:His/Gly/Thr/Pro-type tRNA ligase C-terminal domain-containing protein [Candidatus Magasanikbacteria bacterium]
MRQTKLFTKTLKEHPKDEVSKNAQLLIRAGFIDKTMSGVYNFLPLGLRVLNKINNIIREEMDEAGGQEVFLSTLQNKETWEKSGRWSDGVVDNWFKTKLKNNTELGLAFTHEEAITNIMKNYITSYKNLPFYAYQIQTKFRNETRAKSGLIRGREFLMKDMYSFSKNKEEHDVFYEKMKDVYMKVFGRLGMGDKTYLTISSGGSFSKYSYEFQTLSEAGEDIIYIDEEKNIAINKEDFNNEMLADFDLKFDKNNLVEKKSVEVGDIYSLGYKYSEAFGLKFANEDGKNELVYMGSFGMSPSRLMGTLVELNNDERGIIWPKEVTPFDLHLISLRPDKNEKETIWIYQKLKELGMDVLLDDRLKISAGQKFAESDLMGISTQVILSPKTLENSSVEVKDRRTGETNILPINKLSDLIN